MYLPFQAISNRLVGPRIVSNLFENALRFQLCRGASISTLAHYTYQTSTTRQTRRHGKQHGNTHSRSAGSNISNFKRAVGLAMMKGLYVYYCSTELFESARAMLLD